MEMAFSDFFERREDMKIFISQPMGGLTMTEIMKTRNQVCDLMNINREDLIDNVIKEIPNGLNRDNIWCLGDSIRQMATADLVIFAPGWTSARGCNIEWSICKEYDIPYVEMELKKPYRHTKYA